MFSKFKYNVQNPNGSNTNGPAALSKIVDAIKINNYRVEQNNEDNQHYLVSLNEVDEVLQDSNNNDVLINTNKILASEMPEAPFYLLAINESHLKIISVQDFEKIYSVVTN